MEGAGLKLRTSRHRPRPAALNETPEEKERMTPRMGERQRATGRERGGGWRGPVPELSRHQQLTTLTGDHVAQVAVGDPIGNSPVPKWVHQPQFGVLD